MQPCKCTETHPRLRIVLTGGPGAGKTAVLELVRQTFCHHIAVLPESAGVLFGGGFPREDEPELQRAAQRAIFYVQRELERGVEGRNAAIVLCDRGTLDGGAYWPGPDTLWDAVGTDLAEQIARYDAVIHLRTPPGGNGYNHDNPLRTETAEEAAVIDQHIFAIWSGHPNRFVIDPSRDFLSKAVATVAVLRDLLPDCCRAHILAAKPIPEA